MKEDKEAQAREINQWVDDHFANNVYSKAVKAAICSGIRDYIYQSGYRKPPDRPESMEKVQDIVCYICQAKEMCRQEWRNTVSCEYSECVDQLLATIDIPKGRPPLLSDEEIGDACLIACEECKTQSPEKYAKCSTNSCAKTRRAIAQAQWKTCIKHYEGIDD